MYALAVRSGDVAAVPEPESLALWLVGLMVVGSRVGGGHFGGSCASDLWRFGGDSPRPRHIFVDA